MKIVLKRRKHRNGVRPTRKGTLKVNLQELPTRIQHLQSVTSFMKYKDQQADLYSALDYYEKGNQKEFNRIIITAKYLGRFVDLMQKGFGYFENYKQANIPTLALNAINEVNPIYSKRKSVCESCEFKNNCPFAGNTPDALNLLCPTRRRAFHINVLKGIKGESLDTALDQSEMADLAVKHLS